MRDRSGLHPVIADVMSAALGRSHRPDRVLPRSGGPAGNARLTAWTGIVLLALSLAESLTLFDVRGLISWHVVIGVLLIPPALLKTATTGWRIVRYYAGDPDYVRAGPPPLLLRLLGPAVVVFTLGVLGSGLALIVLGINGSRHVIVTAVGLQINAITVHQALFAGWAVVTGLHVVGRIVPALRLTVVPSRSAPSVPGAIPRTATLLAVAAIAAVAGVLVLATAGSWQSQDHQQDDHPSSASVQRR